MAAVLNLTNQYGETSENYTIGDLDAFVAEMSDESITGKLLTGLAAGTNTPIADTDTILEALANLQAQIDAL